MTFFTQVVRISDSPSTPPVVLVDPVLENLVLTTTKPMPSAGLQFSALVLPTAIRDDSCVLSKPDKQIFVSGTSTRSELLTELQSFSTHMNALFSSEQVNTTAIVAPAALPPVVSPVTFSIDAVSVEPIPVDFSEPPAACLVEHPVLLIEQSLSDELAIVVHPTTASNVVCLPNAPKK